MTQKSYRELGFLVILRVPWACLSLFLAAIAMQALGEKPELSGFYKNFLSATHVADNFKNLGLTDDEWALDDLQRLTLKIDYNASERLEFLLHYELRARWGETERVRDRMEKRGQMVPGTGGLFNSRRPRFLDLESELIRESSFTLEHGLDRAQARWEIDRFEMTVGRQAVTWGTALIWTPTDLFAGFSPTEIDRDEKPGVDVIRAMWAPESGGFVDLIFEPLDESAPYRMKWEESSLAARAGTAVGEYEIALLGGQVAGDDVLGADFTGYLRDAGLRGELVYSHVRERDQRDYFRGVVSIDYGFAAAWNPYVALEYFYNGLGAGDSDNYLERLSESSVRRAFVRGNAFNLGRHYIGNVVRVAPSALWSMQATTLINLLDGSVQEFATATRSLHENVDLQFGANVGIGPAGTEFGGFSAEQFGVEFRSRDLIFIFLKIYF
jgi:hypothetical protein